MLVYKCEIALAVFFGGYLFIASIALAIEGRTIGKISASGIELPDELSSSVANQRTLIDWQEQMQERLIERERRLCRYVELLGDRIERPTAQGDMEER